ncbi:hypothetical protein ACMU_09295 [Actibacterium mucosum KCTC 23349]|uniref:Uncharacterized protein n=1 Tax=Actibacterium mucosum KCTC 23349 TaxID=1454373 RepID=A0A037ZHQ4_9RHOB|nr:hypothetical protein [Actibacterium mucosum]KAJ55950.1 hypothetical protein ACMU_09295 [Actibacterium mucosum KCTC 23349]
MNKNLRAGLAIVGLVTLSNCAITDPVIMAPEAVVEEPVLVEEEVLNAPHDTPDCITSADGDGIGGTGCRVD